MINTENIDTLLSALTDSSPQKLTREIENLKDIKAWAMKQAGIDYAIGDTVEITEPRQGFDAYKDALVPGRTGTVTDIYFSVGATGGDPHWGIVVAFERLFRETGYKGPNDPKYTWLGPEIERPKHMKAYYRPEGATKAFYFKPAHLKKYVEPEPDTCESCGKATNG